MASLREKVVVITGASSGLGRATAVQLARRGCRLVLAARRAAELEDTANMCRQEGVHVLICVTDVSHEAEVVLLADAAIAEYGRIDVWINNAGVTLFAPLSEAPFEEHRRVLETNLFGPMFAARAVVPIFKRQGQGVLINVGSVLSTVGQAFVPSYVISKFALRGLTETLRVELADHRDIHVCSILPYAMDTPHFEAGANEVGRRARAMPPMQSPEKVAKAIVALAEHPRRQRFVPRSAQLGLALHALFPRTTERLLLHALRELHFDDTPERETTGNLYQPSQQRGAVHGHRPPQMSTPGFALWLLRDLMRVQAASLRELLGRRVQPRAT